MLWSAERRSVTVGRVSKPTVYLTTWCPYCKALLSDLAHYGVDFDQVDVDLDDEAAALVSRLNGGERIVPTVVYPDRTHDTNPDGAEVAAKLGLFG